MMPGGTWALAGRGDHLHHCPNLHSLSLHLSWDFSALSNWNHNVDTELKPAILFFPHVELRGRRGVQRGQSHPVPEQFLCVILDCLNKGQFYMPSEL